MAAIVSTAAPAFLAVEAVATAATAFLSVPVAAVAATATFLAVSTVVSVAAAFLAFVTTAAPAPPPAVPATAAQTLLLGVSAATMGAAFPAVVANARVAAIATRAAIRAFLVAATAESLDGSRSPSAPPPTPRHCSQ